MKTYLALGDSYTIGEQVLLTESFPYQLVQLLRQNNIEIAAPEIIAKTGWATDELLAAVIDYHFLKKYDFVSLLIGVNNQYRGKSIAAYEIEFEILLKKAIVLGGNISVNVFVLSIPDWGVTPFATEKNTAKISVEIDAFNAACKSIALLYNCTFIDITLQQRINVKDAKMLASDALHPSAKEYATWAQLLMDNFFDG